MFETQHYLLTMRRLLFTCIIATLALCVNAQQSLSSVILKNGTELRGYIKSIDPSDALTMIISDKEVKIKMSEILQVNSAPANDSSLPNKSDVSHKERIIKYPYDPLAGYKGYLLEKGRLDIYEDDIECTIGYLIDILKEQEQYGKYVVYRDLKDRGFVIKTGFKYGSEFRLYDRGRGPGQGHSDYLVKIIFENYDINALDFASYVRVSHGVNKKLLLAIVDDDFDITYYNVEWTRP